MGSLTKPHIMGVQHTAWRLTCRLAAHVPLGGSRAAWRLTCRLAAHRDLNGTAVQGELLTSLAVAYFWHLSGIVCVRLS